MSMIQSSSEALGFSPPQRRHREVQHRQVHRVEHARQREDREADPLAARRPFRGPLGWMSRAR